MNDAYQIIHADCRDALASMADNSVDAIVTDPPYGLGFMGKRWDSNEGGDNIAFSVDLWREALRVLKPGGHLLAFGGTRTSHRLVCAIEDAGFEIRDSIAWIYATGFPKSRNLHGAHEGWGTALKPAIEPICMARKPVSGTIDANMGGWGVGAINIEATRIEFASDADRKSAFPGGRLTSHGTGRLAGPGAAQDAMRSNFTAEKNNKGRWPSNVFLDEAAARELDQQSGSLTPSRCRTLRRRGAIGFKDDRPRPEPFDIEVGFDDEGGASRFFYVAKPDAAEKQAGCSHLPQPLGDVHNLSTNACSRCGLCVQSNGSGDKCECGPDRVTVKRPQQANNHPTVKPVALLRRLIRLVTPPGGTVLDFFAGSGTTGVAAAAENMRCILVEREAEYIPIIEARLQHAACASDLFAEADQTDQADQMNCSAPVVATLF